VPPYSSIAVANYFLELGEREGRKLTPMQLQKLVYFAHGWHLALKDKPLVQDPIEAWAYGPVVPDLYHALKAYGSGAVTSRLRQFRMGDGQLHVSKPTVTDPDTQRFLERIWKVYGHLSAVQLSAMTHRPNTPWTKVRLANPNRRGVDIPDDEMKRYFAQLASENAAAGR